MVMPNEEVRKNIKLNTGTPIWGEFLWMCKVNMLQYSLVSYLRTEHSFVNSDPISLRKNNLWLACSLMK